MDTLWQDVKYGARMLLKNRSVTLIAVLTLALGIGANTAIFGLLEAVLLRPLPVPEPQRLVQIQKPVPSGGLDNSFNYPLYKDYRDQNSVFEGLAAFDGMPLHLSAGGENDRIGGMIVSGNYFDVLRVRAAYGRTFLPEEDRTQGTHPVAVLGYAFWQRRFGGDPSIVNRQILLNGRSFTVIGVAPRGFAGTFLGSEAELYIPMSMYSAADPAGFGERLNDRRFTWLMIMGRLKPGVSRAQAQAAMQTLSASIAETQPMNTEKDVVLTDASRGFTGLVEDLEGPVTLLQVVVGLVLLITCANVANLLLSRSLARRRELAVRMALGAGRGRLARQLLTESVLVSLAGGAAGVVLAPWIADALLVFRPYPNFGLDLGLNWMTLAFAFGVTLLSGVIFGMAPAWQSARVSLVPALKEDALSGHASRWSVRNLLVTAQIALSLAVLVSAGLCLKSLRGLQGIDAGMDTEHVLIASLDLGRSGYNEARGRQFYSQMLERIATLPGAESIGLARVTPLGGSGMRITATPEGQHPADDKPINLSFNIITPGWFRAVGISVLRGRELNAQDSATAPMVVVVNEAMVRQFWPGDAGVGKHIELSAMPNEPRKILEVVGVVADSKYRSLTEVVPATMFLPFEQNYESSMRIFLRAANPAAVLSPLRRSIQSLDANLPVYGTRTLAEQKANSLYTARLAATLLGLLSTLGLMLAAFGLFGVLAYVVEQRRREIGIRMAIGASRGEVLRLMLRQGMLPVGLGLGVGLIAALVGTRLLRSLLYNVQPQDPATFLSAAIVLLLVSLLACWIPARRATRVDPMVALRYE